MVKNPIADALDRVRLLAVAGQLADSSDGDLVARCATGSDGAAFAVLVERHGPMVFGVCSRILRDSHDAEDACQATFLVLFRRVSSIRRQASVASWLHGVARRVSLALARERAARQRHERQSPPRQEQPDDPPWSAVRAALDEEIERLPEQLRGPVVLCYLEGKTRDEAAATLGLTAGRLHGQLQRARATLHDRLVRRGITLGAGLLVAGMNGGVCLALPPTLALRTINGAVALMGKQELVPALASAETISLVNKVVQAMSYAKLLSVAVWATVGIALAGAAIGGVLAQPAVKPARPAVAPAPAPKAEQPAALEFRPMMSTPAATKDDFRHAVLAVSNAQKSLLSRNFIVSGGDPDARPSGLNLWYVDADKPKRTNLGDSTNIGFVPKSTLAYSVNWGEGVVLWDTRTHAKVGAPIPHALREDTMPNPAVSPDGEVLVARSEMNQIRFWNLKTRKPITDSIPQKGIVSLLEFSSDGKWLFSHNWPGDFKVWAAGTGKLAAGPFRSDTYSLAAGYSPTSQRIVTAENGATKEAEWKSEVVLRSGADWSKVQRVQLTGLTREVAWLGDDHLLIVGQERTEPARPDERVSYGRNLVQVVSLNGAKAEVRTVLRDVPWISHIQIAPDGKHFLTTATRQGTSCWKVGEQKPIWTKAGNDVGHFGAGDWVLLTASRANGASVVSLREGKELWRQEDAIAARVEGANVWLFTEKGVEVVRVSPRNRR